MVVVVACPDCQKSLKIPDGAAGKRLKCSGCGAVSRIRENAAGETELELQAAAPTAPGSKASASASAEATVPCPECGETVAEGERFCGGCGATITAETRETITHEAERQERMAAGRERRMHRHKKQRTKKIANAGKVLLALSIMFAVFGTVLGFMTKKTNDEALRNLDEYDPNEVLELEGKSYSVSELIDMVQAETASVFVTNYVLAAIMLGIYFWSRRAPLPALLTGFGIFIAVHVFNAAIDPKTLAKGIFLKVVFVVMFIGGIKAALAQRAIEEEDEDADPDSVDRSGSGRSRRSASA